MGVGSLFPLQLFLLSYFALLSPSNVHLLSVKFFTCGLGWVFVSASHCCAALASYRYFFILAHISVNDCASFLALPPSTLNISS